VIKNLLIGCLILIFNLNFVIILREKRKLHARDALIEFVVQRLSFLEKQSIFLIFRCTQNEFLFIHAIYQIWIFAIVLNNVLIKICLFFMLFPVTQCSDSRSHFFQFLKDFLYNIFNFKFKYLLYFLQWFLSFDFFYAQDWVILS
jgi:hypothetical protein